MAQQPARPAISTGHAVGLLVFLVTAVFLIAMFLARLGSTADSSQSLAAAVSTACAAAAAFVMLVDGVDVWLRDRALTPPTVKLLRRLVFVTVLGALLGNLFGGNSLALPVLLPAMAIYLFTIWKPIAGAARRGARARWGGGSGAGRSGGGRSGGGGSGGSAAERSRQRRGGRRRR